MIIVKFTKNPDGALWVGWTEYQNGTYFATGRTLDALIKRMKVRLWTDKGVSARQVYLDTKKSETADVPVEKMSRIFYGKYWKQRQSKAQHVMVDAVPQETTAPKPAYDYFEYKVKDGRLVVYGVKRDMITSYDLRKNQTEGGENGGNE